MLVEVDTETGFMVCSYCRNALRSVGVFWVGAKPCCGCAECLLMAAREARESVA